MFCCRNNYIRYNSINSVLKRIFRVNLALSDRGISSHILRHSFATRCKESEMDIMVTSNVMGHHEVAMTLEHYTEIQYAFKSQELHKLDEYIEKQIGFEPKSI